MIKELKDWGREILRKAFGASAAQPALEAQEEKSDPAFMATVRSVSRRDNNGMTAYFLMLEVDGVSHAVPSYIFNQKIFQDRSNVAFDDLKQGDVIKTAAAGSVFEAMVPVAILSGIERCPPGASAKNDNVPQIGYRTVSVPAPRF